MRVIDNTHTLDVAAADQASLLKRIHRLHTDCRRSGLPEREQLVFPYGEFCRHSAPKLCDLATAARRRVEQYGWVIVRGLMPADNRNRELCATTLLLFCGVLGPLRHTALSQRRIVWDVRVRPGVTHPTISEHNRASELHTDACYRDAPERFMALLCMQPASDGGGMSTIVQSEQVLRHIASLRVGRKHLSRLYRTAVRFVVPPTFRTKRDEREYHELPILDAGSFVRYREDCLPSHWYRREEPALFASLRYLRQQLRQMPVTELMLQAGDVLVLDNHHTLHGRSTPFDDSRRHLLRVRAD